METKVELKANVPKNFSVSNRTEIKVRNPTKESLTIETTNFIDEKRTKIFVWHPLIGAVNTLPVKKGHTNFTLSSDKDITVYLLD